MGFEIPIIQLYYQLFTRDSKSRRLFINKSYLHKSNLKRKYCRPEYYHITSNAVTVSMSLQLIRQHTIKDRVLQMAIECVR